MTEKKKDDKTEAKPESAPEAKPAAKKSVDWENGKHDVLRLSKHTGNRIKMNGHNPSNETGPGPMHCAADILHGWTWHRHNYAKPVELSKKDYLAAIKAAGSFNRHPAAIAPHFKPPTKE